MTKTTPASSFLRGTPMIWTKTDEATASSASIVATAMVKIPPGDVVKGHPVNIVKGHQGGIKVYLDDTNVVKGIMFNL